MNDLEKEEVKRSIEAIKKLKEEIPEREKTEEKEIDEGKIIIRPYETFKLHDLANMFPFNITPALIESKIQHALAAKHKMQEMTRNFVILALIIMIGGTIAAYIAYKFFGGQGEEQQVKVIVDYAGNIIGGSSNFTG